MHRKHEDKQLAPPSVPVTFVLEDPEALGENLPGEVKLIASKNQNLLDLAMGHGINIEHACGGVCACSTCHVYIKEGMGHLSESKEDEDDRVEEAPGLQANSRLSCQTVIEGDGPIVVRVPAWNRNAVKENPH